MKLFLAVVEAGGLATGGRRLGLSPASVSERVAAMEAWAGVRLLTRTTRSIRLTEEGRLYAEAARGILAEVGDLDARLREGKERISGHLRIAATFDLGRNQITPLIDAFMERHPAVSIELVLSDAFGDVVAEGIDLAIRYGTLADSGLTQRKLAVSRRLICAAPAYLERNGAPQHPEGLAAHNCLVMRFGAFLDNRWHFTVEGKPVTVTISGNRRANDGDLIRRWAVAGHGIARKSVWDVADDLAAGRLVELLGDYASPESSLQIVYPGGRHLPRRARALIDYLVTRFEEAAEQTVDRPESDLKPGAPRA